jgi:hypothetical protein
MIIPCQSFLRRQESTKLILQRESANVTTYCYSEVVSEFKKFSFATFLVMVAPKAQTLRVRSARMVLRVCNLLSVLFYRKQI